MKLGNFLRFDPNYKGRGLARGNTLEQEIWKEFAQSIPRLQKIATAIRETLKVSPEFWSEDNLMDEAEAVEGAILTRIHRLRERNPSLVHAKKDRVIEKEGA